MNSENENPNNKLHDHELHQDSILQATRNLHYVFQTIFLGVSFTTLAIGYSIFFSNNYEEQQIYMVPALVLGMICQVVIGILLMKQYSNAITKRGLVIDFVQHLSLLKYQGKLDSFLNHILDERRDGEVFVLIKLAEKISAKWRSQPKGKREAIEVYGRLCTSIESVNVKNILDLLPLHPTILSSNGNSAPLTIFPYILLYNDIFNTDYISKMDAFESGKEIKNWTEMKTQRRNVSPNRDGHLSMFWGAWCIVIALLVVLTISFLFKFDLISWF